MYGTFLVILLGLLGPADARADEDAASRLRRLKALPLEELLNVPVRTASLRPAPLWRAPATTYVIMAEEIAASGAHTLPDLLRRVPGLDVTGFRTLHGEVSVRGLNDRLNNRTLILLDGRTLLNPRFDSISWPSLPVGLEEIARIEVVAGPASALYGANAVQGVVNIITKTAAEAAGTRLRYSAGERNLHGTGLLHAVTTEGRSQKFSAGYFRADRFEGGGLPAAETGRAHAELGWELPQESRLSLAGGVNRRSSNFSARSGPLDDDGVTGFLRADAELGRARLRGFWNAERTVIQSFPSLKDPSDNSDVLDLTADRSWTLPGAHEAAAGLTYRRNAARSSIFPGGRVSQDLYAVFAEDEWRPLDALSVVAGARADKHPRTDWTFSPRGSLILRPVPDHIIRFSGGSAFRNPTLVENHVDATVPLAGSTTRSVGNPSLAPERLTSFEAAHLGRFGPLRTQVTGFYYRLTGIIRGTPVRTVSLVPLVLETSQQNSGETKALGYEAALDWAARPGLSMFANYSYQTLADQLGEQGTAVSAPKHKANAGARLERGSGTLGLWLHWQDKTLWTVRSGERGSVAAYALLNAHAGWRLAGAGEGWELSLDAFNLGGHRHYEARPRESAARPGQGAEALGRTVLGSVSYQY